MCLITNFIFFVAPGAKGNVSTALVCAVIERMGGVHGMDREFMLDARDHLRRVLGNRSLY